MEIAIRTDYALEMRAKGPICHFTFFSQVKVVYLELQGLHPASTSKIKTPETKIQCNEMQSVIAVVVAHLSNSVATPFFSSWPPASQLLHLILTQRSLCTNLADEGHD